MFIAIIKRGSATSLRDIVRTLLRGEIAMLKLVTPPKKSAYNWMKDPRVQSYAGYITLVITPTGWNKGDGITMRTPTTWEEFAKRLAESQIIYWKQ